MNELNDRQNKLNDEIDIFEFGARIWKVFTGFLTELVKLKIFVIIFFFRKILWILSFALLGGIIGFLYCSLKKPVYTSMLEGTSGGVDNSVVIDHINNLRRMNNRHEILAATLGLTVEEAKKIKSVKAFYGIDVNRDDRWDFIDVREKYDPKDTTQNRVPSVFFIQLSLYNEDVLPVLRENLFQYINNNAYLQKLFELDSLQKRQIVRELTSEIAKLDTLRAVQLRKDLIPNRDGQIVVTGNLPEPRTYYSEMLTLFERKLAIEKALALNTEIILVIQDFTQLQDEEKSATNMAFKYGFVMAIMGLLFGIFWQFRIIIWKLITEDSTKR